MSVTLSFRYVPSVLSPSMTTAELVVVSPLSRKWEDDDRVGILQERLEELNRIAAVAILARAKASCPGPSGTSTG
jgi:hypothetical protein